MSHTSKLEDIIALSEDKDRMVIKRVYDLKTNYDLDSNMGAIYIIRLIKLLLMGRSLN